MSLADLRAGDLVYRVVIDVPPGEEAPWTWMVASAVVEHASAKQIKLKTYFPGSFRKVFDPSAYPNAFFETPLRAIQWFLAERRSEIEALDRHRTEAERAIAWAISQEGMPR